MQVVGEGAWTDETLALVQSSQPDVLIFELLEKTESRRQLSKLRDACTQAKLLAADVSWEAANACLQFHGGFGFATEYEVERKFRETRLYQVAPVSTNMILSYVAEHVLGLPRSF